MFVIISNFVSAVKAKTIQAMATSKATAAAASVISQVAVAAVADVVVTAAKAAGRKIVAAKASIIKSTKKTVKFVRGAFSSARTFVIVSAVVSWAMCHTLWHAVVKPGRNAKIWAISFSVFFLLGGMSIVPAMLMAGMATDVQALVENRLTVEPAKIEEGFAV